MNSRRIQTLKHPRRIAQILIFVFVYKDQLWYSSRRTIEKKKLNIEANDFSKNELYHYFEYLDIVLGELEVNIAHPWRIVPRIDCSYYEDHL